MMSGTPPAPQAPPVFDPFAPRTDDHAFVRALAARAPLARTPGGAFYAWRARHADIVTSPDTSRQIELETLAMQGIVDGPIHELFVNGMLFSNGAAHRRRRGPVARTFAFKLMEGMREEIRALAESLIEPRAGAGAFDFLGEVAGALPASVIARVLGVPDADVPQFTRWAYSAVRCLPIHRPEDRPQIARDLAALLDYVDALLAARRARPRDDFLSRFADAAGAEGDMSGAEIRAQIAGLIFAGSDTTRLGIATTLSQLLQHPAQWRAFVADPDGLKKQAVEEGLRFDPVIATIPRVALVDLDLHGLLHDVVAQHLAQRAAVAAADDDHAARRGVREQRRVRHHLVIQEIVALAEHDAAVDHHQMAEGFGGVDLDVLIGGLFFMQFRLDLEPEGATARLVEFRKPLTVHAHVCPQKIAAGPDYSHADHASV